MKELQRKDLWGKGWKEGRGKIGYYWRKRGYAVKITIRGMLRHLTAQDETTLSSMMTIFCSAIRFSFQSEAAVHVENWGIIVNGFPNGYKRRLPSRAKQNGDAGHKSSKQLKRKSKYEPSANQRNASRGEKREEELVSGWNTGMNY